MRLYSGLKLDKRRDRRGIGRQQNRYKGSMVTEGEEARSGGETGLFKGIKAIAYRRIGGTKCRAASH